MKKKAVTPESTPEMGAYRSVASVAKYLDVSENTVRHWIFTGRLAACKVGRRRVIAHSDLLALIQRPGVAA